MQNHWYSHQNYPAQNLPACIETNWADFQDARCLDENTPTLTRNVHTHLGQHFLGASQHRIGHKLSHPFENTVQLHIQNTVTCQNGFQLYLLDKKCNDQTLL